VIPAIGQLTVNAALELIGAVARKADQARAGISMNNARIMELDQRGSAIADPAKRAAFKRSIQSAVREQAAIAGLYRGTAAKITAARTALARWMRAQGLDVPPGLGIIQAGLIPAAVVGGAALWGVLAVVDSINRRTTLQSQKLNAIATSQAEVDQGRRTPAEHEAFVRSLDAATKTPTPFGLDRLGEALLPIAALVAAALILPPMLARRRA